MEEFEKHQDEYSAKIKEVKDFMTTNFKNYFSNLHLNKFYANCLKISASNYSVEFDESFQNTPEVFVTVNRFMITYGNEGNLEKKGERR